MTDFNHIYWTVLLTWVEWRLISYWYTGRQIKKILREESKRSA